MLLLRVFYIAKVRIYNCRKEKIKREENLLPIRVKTLFEEVLLSSQLLRT